MPDMQKEIIMASTKQTVSADDLSTFGARLRAAREEQDLSRPALAKLTDNIVTARIIDHLEKGTSEATIQKSELLAKALGVSTDWLSHGKGNGPVAKPEASPDMASLDEEEAEDNAQEDTGARHLTGLLDLLEEIEGYRLDGFTAHTRKMPLLIEDAEIAAEYLEPVEIEMIALERCAGEVKLPEALQQQHTAHLSFRNRTRQARREDAERTKYDTALQEVVDRIIDTAVLGLDLYSVDLSVLSTFARKHDISSPHFFGGWEHHSEIVPRVREKYRDMALQGRISLSQSLLHA